MHLQQRLHGKRGEKLILPREVVRKLRVTQKQTYLWGWVGAWKKIKGKGKKI